MPAVIVKTMTPKDSIITLFLKDELPTNVVNHVGHCHNNALASFSSNNASLPRYKHLSCLLV